jgi:hypothetical protein
MVDFRTEESERSRNLMLKAPVYITRIRFAASDGGGAISLAECAY